MPESLAGAIARLVALEKANVDGLEMAYEFAPEALGVLPCFVNWPRESVFVDDALGGIKGNHTIVCQYFAARGILPLAEERHRIVLTSFPDAVFGDRTLNGTVSSVIPPIRASYGILTYGAHRGQPIQYFGISFEVEVKIRRVL